MAHRLIVRKHPQGTVHPPAPSQQLKFVPGHWYMTENCEFGTNTGSGGPNQMTTEVAAVKASPAMVAYIPCMHAKNTEDYTQTTNLALTLAAGATGAALQNAINMQYPGFATWESWFYYLQSQFPTTGMYTGLIINFVGLNTAITQSQLTGGTTWAGIIPKDLLQCGGSITVPNVYGSTATTTYPVAPIYSGSSYYGMGFCSFTGQPAWVSGNSYALNARVSYNNINYNCTAAVSGTTPPPSDTAHWASAGAVTFNGTLPAFWNPGVNQRQRTQLWQAFYQRTFTYGPTYSPTTVYMPGQVVTWTDNNSYLCILPTPGANSPANKSYWMLNRWAGKTPEQVPEFAYAKNNDEYSYNCAGGNFSGGPVVNPPYQGSNPYPATRAQFRLQHELNVLAIRAIAPTTPYGDCISFGFTGSDGYATVAEMQAMVNDTFPGNAGNGLSRIRGWVLSNSDMMPNTYNLGAPGNGWKNPYLIYTYSGAIGLSNGDQWSQTTDPYYATQVPHVAAYDLTGKIGWDAQVQLADYGTITSPGQPAGNSEAIIAPIVASANYGQCHMMTWCPTDSTFSGSVWASYIYPGIVASLSTNPLTSLLPLYWMYGPTITAVGSATRTSLQINWSAITGQGTGLSIVLYRNGTQVASGNAASLTSYVDTGLSPNTTYSYTLAMQNANGTGQQGAAVQGTTLT